MTENPNASNLAFVEAVFEAYREDPQSVSADWRAYFEREGFNGHPLGPRFSARSLFNPAAPGANGATRELAHNLAAAPLTATPSRLADSIVQPPLGSLRPGSPDMDIAIRQDRVDQLIRAYRVRGHMAAAIDPLELPRPNHRELDPGYYGLTDEDLTCRFSSRTIYGTETLTLQDILQRLRNTYCRSIGVQFMHIHDIEAKNWLQDRMEGTENRLAMSAEAQHRILRYLTSATTFEEFIQKKYLGKKSFSLEGAESLIPLLKLALERAAHHGADEVILGMAHRGRLNVLANIMGKNPREIFREFEDLDPQLHRGRGDVKYHMGYSSDYVTHDGKKLHLSLCFNPSHLEYVNPVVVGRTRAKQDRAGDAERRKKVALCIHGDAAFIGEGVVQETFNMSELTAYNVGGTVHVVVNNQIGFTTPPEESRSSTYCTDIAKMLQIPIFHVNGEDPEAVAQTVRLAMDFRAEFKRDVVIDMYCYRRHGHNETDDPMFTQPVMYRAIQKRSRVQESYRSHLIEMGGVSAEEADAIAKEQRAALERELSAARQKNFSVEENWLGGVWQGYRGGLDSETEDVDTGGPTEHFSELLLKQTIVPSDFHPHRTIRRLLDNRAEMARGERPLDWGAAEILAFASLVTSSIRVRLTGQDSARGTFAHRHAVMTDVTDGRTYTPLAKFENQAPVEIYNSPLSEAAVMAFEWGYSLDWPDALVAWEAQFGDFCNAAQVIIDQFVVSAEDKWKRLSGLVLLLPHGFEGMGPEHSSARMERFLLLSAEENIQVCQPTTPAQHFHLLRRQALRKFRKPLVVFTPKSLLRHPRATSKLEEFSNGRFERVIGDTLVERKQPVTRILLCTGKLYYELESYRETLGRDDVAIIRLEQLYPVPKKWLAAALEPYPAKTPVIWVQEEPLNMGAWAFIRLRFGERIFGRFPLSVVARDESASPATGSASSHKIEQQELIDKAYGSSQ